MKVILKKNIDKLGGIGDVVNVSEGHARNYLFPQGLAVNAGDGNVKAVEHHKKVIQDKINTEKKHAEKVAEKLSAHSCTITKKAGEEDKLFGSVTSADIEEALKKAGFEISRKDIVIPEHIKTLGVYTIPVKVYHGVEAHLKVWVVKE
ncbi:MAG: 50S ribosomal protein L9 [Pseudomonadota bacterium]